MQNAKRTLWAGDNEWFAASELEDIYIVFYLSVANITIKSETLLHQQLFE